MDLPPPALVTVPANDVVLGSGEIEEGSRVCSPSGASMKSICEEFAHESASGGRAPVATTDRAADEAPLSIDEIEGGRAPDAVEAARNVATPVEQHRRV